MENVLKMVNPPTNSEMKANTKRAVEKKPSAWLMSLDCSLATVCPVTTSTPFGSAAAMAWLHGGLVGPGRGQDIDGLVVPDLAERALRRRKLEGGDGGSGQIVRRAEFDDAADGERLRGTGKEHADVVAHEKWYFCAVPASITTSCGEVGAVPDASWSAESWGSASYDRPSVGAPPLLMALPSGATNWAYPPTVPSANCHAGNVAHRGGDRLRDGLAHCIRAGTGVGECRLAADLEIDILIDVTEQRIEGVVQRVGKDERSGNEGDSEHDGQGRQRQAQLVGQQTPKDDSAHLSRPGASCVRAPNPRWVQPVRRPPSRRPGTRRGRRRPLPVRHG